ncbi:PQQ-dependent sugar dehydrogenase [Paenibacillus sp. TRM 82003]|nr:PQQ-dependent sugar dehydrogenase [Paenibacillus sp. TRM 82003]
MKRFKTRSRLIAAALICSIATGCAGWGGEPPADGETAYDVLATDLDIPWAIDFSGESVYVSERGGSVVRIAADGTVERKPAALDKPLYEEGEAGLLGFALAPDFPETGAAFAYYTYEEAGHAFNRIVSLVEGESAWEESEVLLDGIPGAYIHDGGRLAVGPDGYLYATTGDAGDGALAQRTDGLAGKTLRLSQNGAVPADNPTPGSYVFSYGHRNPQGIAWDASGVMYASEHGPSGNPGGHDELNRIEPGANYGWPLVYGDEKKKGTVPPLFHTGDPAIAPSGIAIDDEGRMLVAALRGQALYRYELETGNIEKLLEGEGRLRDVKFRDGFVFAITNNTDGRGSPRADDDRLLRLAATP